VVRCPINGHSYALVAEALPWEEARRYAEALSGSGKRAYLGTITSPEENEWLRKRVFSGEKRPACLWIGAFQGDGPEPDGGWQWVTGEKWGWTNWMRGEPNDSPHDENCVELHPRTGNAEWNDGAGRQELPFLVEFEPGAREGEEKRAAPALRCTVTLDEGSVIRGNPTMKALKMRHDWLGEIEASLREVQRIQFSQDHETVKLTSCFRDVLNVRLDLSAFELETVFGQVSPPVQRIASIRIHVPHTSVKESPEEIVKRIGALRLLKEGSAIHSGLIRAGRQQRGNVPEQFWGKAIRQLRPVRVYMHGNNVVCVLQSADGVEEGIYINIPVSSYLPRSGDDGFTFTAIGNGIHRFRRVRGKQGLPGT